MSELNGWRAIAYLSPDNKTIVELTWRGSKELWHFDEAGGDGSDRHGPYDHETQAIAAAEARKDNEP